MSSENDGYEKIQQCGEGQYGKVYKAKDTTTGKMVALKRIRLEGEKEGFPLTAIREIRILQKLRHPNILSLLEILSAPDGVYMVIDYMDYDLTGMLSHPEVTFSEPQIKCVMQQMLSGLAYLHTLGILHRDIKGSNVLMDANGNVRLADFGLARVSGIVGLPLVDQEDADQGKQLQRDFTNRVITLWYRPVELLLGDTVYNDTVDIWGIGCLLLEMYVIRAVFQGVDEQTQLIAIYKVMGTPSVEEWPQIQDLPWFYLLQPSELYESKFEYAFGKVVSQSGIKLAQQLLAFNPVNRLSAISALEHDYFMVDEPLPCGPKALPRPEGDWHEYESKIHKRRKAESSAEDSSRSAKRRQKQT